MLRDVSILVAILLLGASIVHADPNPIMKCREHVIETINRTKCYPETTSSGMARVRFEIDRGGRTVSARILISSGSDLLDETALIMVDQLFQPPPKELSGDRVRVEAIAFSCLSQGGRMVIGSPCAAADFK